jgi:hypothetical protein
MREVRAILAAAVLALPLGCRSDVSVTWAYDPLVAFPRQATVAWERAAIQLPEDPRIAALDAGPLIEKVVLEQLAARGYTEGDPARAQYLLSYQLRVDWVKVSESETLGTLSVALAEARSGRRVWTGYARAALHASRTEPEREQRIRDAVRRMLEEFPPS